MKRNEATVFMNSLLCCMSFCLFLAMRNKPVPGNVRVPTSAWSGYGLSHSSPAPELEHRKKESFAASLLDVTNQKH
jgi:hypothetical protein